MLIDSVVIAASLEATAKEIAAAAGLYGRLPQARGNLAAGLEILEGAARRRMGCVHHQNSRGACQWLALTIGSAEFGAIRRAKDKAYCQAAERAIAVQR